MRSGASASASSLTAWRSVASRTLRPLCLGLLASGTLALAQPASGTGADSSGWRDQFVQEVDRRLDVPVQDQQRYILLLRQALAEAGTPLTAAQAFVVVDRSPQVQAVFVIMRTQAGDWQWTGASPVSTGQVGSFDHFMTPLGVFAHTLENPDFRAEGSFNENHIRGYGLQGRRIFDFGWATATRGWGNGGTSPMRLQMHATDPTTLEPKLGRVASKGCIRIPATLNVFLDRHGILDADYEDALRGGKSLWVLGPARDLIPSPGRYLVIIDSMASVRPAWSPLPGATPPPALNAPEMNPAATPELPVRPVAAASGASGTGTQNC